MVLSFILTDSYIITTHPKSNCSFITVVISWLFREAVAQKGNVCTPWGMEGFPCGSAGKESACNVGDLGSIPGLGRSPEEGKGYSLQDSGLENSMDCIIHGATKSRTRLTHFTSHGVWKMIQWCIGKEHWNLCFFFLEKSSSIINVNWLNVGSCTEFSMIDVHNKFWDHCCKNILCWSFNI